MKNEREFTGTLLGFDDFVSEHLLSSRNCVVEQNLDMVLKDVTE